MEKNQKIVDPYWFQERTLDSPARYIVMLGGTGGGKALACDTEIPTINGFIKMSDLKAGDIVFDPTGLSMPEWKNAPPPYWVNPSLQV